ncbi:MAG: hypothetical protein KGS72_26070 [Cyanobacteria bacterium REEB67]|nr:hypothetical protein [Cyanobacteria bacterium REEB67]
MGAILWLSLRHLDLIWLLAVGAILLSFIAVIVGLPILVTILFLNQYRGWTYWKNLRKNCRPFSKASSEFEGGITVYGNPESKFQMPMRMAIDAAAIYLRPDLSFSKAEAAEMFKPLANTSTDGIGIAVGFLLSLPLFLPLALFKFAFRPLQIPWSVVKTVRQEKDRLLLDVNDTTVQISLSGKVLEGIQQYCPVGAVLKAETPSSEP